MGFAPTPRSASSAGSSVGAEISQLGIAGGRTQERLQWESQKGCREEERQEAGGSLEMCEGIILSLDIPT